MSAKLQIMRVQLDSDAKERLDELCKRRGMTQIAIMSRVVSWFSKQDDFIQTAVLHALSEASMTELAKSYLKKQAK